MKPDSPLDINDGLVKPHELPELVKRLREQYGMTRQEVAGRLGVSEAVVRQAEEQPDRARIQLRKRMIERLSDYRLEGPFYRLRRTEV